MLGLEESEYKVRLSKVEVLSNKEIIEIDEASKEILEETGVMVLSEEVLKIYEKGGAKVDYDNMRFQKNL